MSNLVKHARREMEIAGIKGPIARPVVKMVQTFANMGHSGSSAMFCIALLEKLLSFENLTPLTDSPNEWNLVQKAMTDEETDVWQSNRNPEAFSPDGGKHYYLLSEGANFTKQEPLHATVSEACWRFHGDDECKPGENHPAAKESSDGTESAT